MPGSTTKIDIAPASVVEGIDLPTQPSLGTAWDATDGNEDLDSQLFVTPCEVLVSVLTAQFNQGKEFARMVGYEISTGQQGWTIPLRQATGLDNPQVDADPTYTPDCQMVLTFHDDNTVIHTKTGLMIDLDSGRTTVLSFSNELVSCAASGPGMAACMNSELSPGLITVLDSSGSVIGKWDAAAFDSKGDYLSEGDLVVDQLVLSGMGYRDPNTGNIVFGSDIQAGELISKDEWVVYREPYLPGGLKSGLAVRVQGPLEGNGGTCTVMAWETSSDEGLWDTPASIPCGWATTVRFSVAGSVLIVRIDNMDESTPVIQAYSWATGSFLWQSDQRTGTTGWDRAHPSASYIFGLTSDYVVLHDDTNGQTTVVGITDGVPIAVPVSDSVTVLTLTETIAYTTTSGSRVDAYSLTGSGDQLWFVQLATHSLLVWTFAVNGAMYLVYGDYGGHAWVAPLIE